MERDREPELARRFVAHVRGARLLEPGTPVLVAVSGGLDSLVLLHLLRFHGAPLEPRVSAAHFDHRMREGSGADAAWVAGVCRAWAVPLRAGCADAAPRSEAEARTARYRFLEEAAESAGAERILTAHHADDQAETVLFRAARGTGVRGLAGIPPRRGRIVRPLLPFTREELERYARAAGLRWREDPSNLDLRYTRNRVRLQALPLLESIVPGATRALDRLADHARAEESAWRWVVERLLEEAVVEAAEGAIVLARPVLLSYHPAVRARLLRAVLRRYGSRPDQAGTRAALEFISSGASGRAVEAAGGVRIEREFDRIRIARAAPPEAADRPLRVEAAGSGAGTAVVGGRRVRVRWSVDEPLGGAALRLGALSFPLTVRGWQPGDRIRLGYGSKRLKRLFAERRVARSERARVPVVADAGGRIVWVSGLARAAGTEPAAGQPVLYLALSDAENS